jgi:hypothetical protein
MRFSSDSQRRAIFRNMFSKDSNRFAIDVVRSNYMPKDMKGYYDIVSDDNPSVEGASLYNFTDVPTSEITRVIKKADDSDLAGLNAIMVVPDGSRLLQGKYKIGYYNPVTRDIVLPRGDFTYENHEKGSIMMHEIGHHVCAPAKKGDHRYKEDLANLYEYEVLNQKDLPEYWESIEAIRNGLPPVDLEPTRQDMVYYRTLKGLKNPSIQELEGMIK